jgi:hypothetical protein
VNTPYKRLHLSRKCSWFEHALKWVPLFIKGQARR